MAAKAANPGATGREANPLRRQVLLGAYAGIVLLGVMFGVPPYVVDILLICSACFTAGLALIVALARKMEELTTFPSLVMGATCLHLIATVAAARRIVLGDGQAGIIAGAIGARLSELSGVILAAIFLIIAVASLSIILGTVRFLRTKAVLNIAILAGNPAGQGQRAMRLAFNTGMGWAARYIVLDAVTAVLLLCIAVGAAGVIGTIEGVNYVSSAAGVGLAAIAPALALAGAAAWLMNRGFIICKVADVQPEKKQARNAAPEQKPAAATAPVKEAIFDEPSSVRAQREYERIAGMALDGPAKDAKVILFAARSSSEMGVTIPVNVAAVMAHRKRRCLIVDMDVARDAVAKAFDIGQSDGPTKTCIRGLYVWSAKSFCDATLSPQQKLEAAQKHFDKTIVYWPGAGQGHDDVVQNVSAAMFFGGKGVEMSVLESRLARRGCIVLK
jgi:hypothetical protein